MKKLFHSSFLLAMLFGFNSLTMAESNDDLGLDELSPVTGVGEVIGGDNSIIYFKGMKKSNLNFEKMDADLFLSFKKWKDETDEKELFPNWENVIRERGHKEIIGHFYQCYGECRIDRAESFFNARYRTNIYEGDEVATQKNSYAWIFLMDGTMVRLSPESSISLNEINIGQKENFIAARVNAGNVLWLSRFENFFIETNSKETEQLFLPANVFEANPIREIKKAEIYDLLNYIEEPRTNENHYKRLNQLIEKNNSWTKGKPTYVFLVCPNITLMGYSPALEIISLLGGKTFVKNRTSEELGLSEKIDAQIEYQLRGFENKEVKKLDEGQWWEIDEKGRNIGEAINPSLMVVGEFPTKRIPSIMMAREYLMEDYSKIFFQDQYDRLQLAAHDGYRLWGKLKDEGDQREDLSFRLEYLKEYFRRAETTNLLSSQHFREQLKRRGESTQSMDYGNYFFLEALDRYYTSEDYSDERESGEVLNSTTKKIWKMMHGLK